MKISDRNKFSTHYSLDKQIDSQYSYLEDNQASEEFEVGSDVEGQVSNIKDSEGFKNSLILKLDQMVDPDSCQLLSVSKSKKLYQAITKQ